MQVYYEKNFGDIQKVRSLKIPEFDLLHPPRPTLVRFRAPSSPLPLPPPPPLEKKLMMSTSIFGELNMSFKNPQWNLYKVDIIGA